MTSQKDKAVGEAVRAIFARRDVAHIHEILEVAATKAWLADDCLRLVGGAMRDLYLGRKVKDLDFATPLEPGTLLEVFRKHSVRVLNIGAAQEHGTIIVEVFDTRIEITTLRRDVATDGRHAKVEFTTDWEEDAARRDFTMNAIYGAPDGTIYDYHNGREHVRAGKIRFIGTPADRIAEDALRVLRFFRFHAELNWTRWYKDETYLKDWTGWSAANISALSGDRISNEFSTILACDSPWLLFEILGEMEETGILGAIFGTNLSITREMRRSCAFFTGTADRCELELIEKLKQQNQYPTKHQKILGRLGLLINCDATRAKKCLGLTNAEANWLEPQARISSVLAWNTACQRLYDANVKSAGISGAGLGAVNRTLQVALIQCAQDNPHSPEKFVEAALAWRHIPFPIDGYALRIFGVEEGKEMGVILAQAREFWLERDRKPDREQCLEYARDFLLKRRNDR